MKIQTKSNAKYTVIVNNRAFPDFSSGCVLALGHFDGVHAAHTKIAEEAISLKKENSSALVGAWTFYQNPASLIYSAPVPYIYTAEKKAELLLSLGLDFVILADFEHFRGLSAEDFITEHLIRELHCCGAVCGFNYRFGRGGAGEPSLLCARLGYENVRVVEEIKINGCTVSSTEIRRLISEGDVEGAYALLGRPFSLEAEVISGKRLGKTIGIPTANQLFPIGGAVPRRGIYATLCRLDNGRAYIGVSNVGTRPTISDRLDDHSLNCETYITNFDGDIYGQTLKIEFFKFLRPEKKFDSLDALHDAIMLDAEQAKTYLAAAIGQNGNV